MADDVQTTPTQDSSASTPDAGTFDWQGAAQSAGGGTGGSDVQVPMRPPEDGSTPVATSAQPTASPNSTGQPSNAAFDDVHPKAVEPMPLPVVHPVRRSGLAGIVDEIRDAIAGKTTTNIGTDAQGNKYVRKDDMTHGQQWMRIASTALHGAAAGMANGQGPGGAGRALAAGVGVADKAAQQKQQMTKDQEQQVKQDQLDKYNMIKMKHDTAAWDFEATRRGIKASQEDLKFAQEQIDHEHTLGSADLGIYKDPTELTKVQQQDPTFWKNVYANNVITVPEIDPASGERKGIHVFLRTPGIGNQLVPKGTPIKTFVPGDKPTDPPKLTTTIPTVPMTQDQVDQYNNAAQTKYSGWQKEQEDLKDKASQRALRDEQTKTQQTEQLKNKGEANKANAEATKNLSEAAKNRAMTGEASSSLVDEIGNGKMVPGRLSYLMARNPQLLEAVAQKYPDFDSSKIESYAATYKDFTSGHTSVALNAGGTALGHLAELNALNTTMSHVPHTPEWTAYQNKASTVATELAKFYGDATIPAIDHIRETLTSTLPGNRNKAIATQAQSMGDKLDSYQQTWENAAPSKAYQAAMPTISPRAMEARASLDPDYAKRRVAELNSNPQKVVAAHPAPSGMVSVQIPGQPTGHIPQAALEQFKKDHPNAQVIQQ